MSSQRHELPAATTIVRSADRLVALRVPRLDLEIIGPGTHARMELSGRRVRIGSAPTNDLVLDDRLVSRFHCSLIADDTGFRLLDERSANGTFVNGVQVRDGYLPDGARVQLGETLVVVRFGKNAQEVELSQEERFGALVGRSVGMRELFALARRAASSSLSVVILGETGTGKDLLARAIHDHSPRAAGPYQVFDCGAVAPTLIEAALFGHVRGAFTGADSERAGVFEHASGGTLFLDELGELPLHLQPKLLRVLETGTLTRIGSPHPVRVDVRVVAATNRDLHNEVEEERFRADLFYRLAVVPLTIPPLRERPEDIPLLAAHFLGHLLVHSRADAAWLGQHLDGAFGSLAHHRWPGNVRELRNVVERAAAMADPAELRKDGFARLVALRTCIGETMRRRPPLAAAREQFDRDYLRDLLTHTAGDRQRAAELADIHPKSFARLLRRYGMS